MQSRTHRLWVTLALVFASLAPSTLAQTILSGPYNAVSITGDISILANTSATFTGGSTFSGANATLGGNAYLYWNQVGALAAKNIALGTGTTLGYINVGGTSGSLTLGAGTVVTGAMDIYGNAGTTITNQGSITNSAGTGYLYGPTVSNQGTLTANSGSTFYLGYYSGETTSNLGTVTADGAGTNLYVHNITNTGTITATNGGILRFTGATTTAGLGTVSIGTGGGHAYLNSGLTLDNTAGNLTKPTGGTFELTGGTISNGNIAAGALTFTNNGGTLAGATLNDNLALAGNAYVTFTGGATFTGANASIAGNSYLYWNQTGTLSGKSIAMGTATTLGYLSVGNSGSLTLGTGTAVTGAMDIYGSAGTTITNQGSITETSGYGYLYGPTVSNQGTLTANGGSTFYLGYYSGETTSNSGTVTADGAATNLYVHNITNTGTISATNGGTVRFTGATTTAGLGSVAIGTGGGHAYLDSGLTLDNSVGTLSAPSGGPFELTGATINGGAIGAGALTFTNYGGTLSGVSINDNLALAANAYVTFTTGTTFTGANASIAGNGYLYWNQTGTLSGKTVTMGTGTTTGHISVGNSGSLTLGAGTAVTGTMDIYGNTGTTITNQGSITQTSGYGYLYGPTVSNQGTLTANGGSTFYLGYYSGEATSNSGTVTADGAGTNLYVHNITNTGTISATNGGIVRFTGATTTAGLGRVSIGTGGGHTYLDYGLTLDNSAGTLASPTGGTFELTGAAINGGAIGAGALTFTNYGGTLSGVSINDNLSLPAYAYAYFTGGTTFTGANANIAGGAYLYWNQTGTLSAKTIAMGTGTSYGNISVGTTGSLTLGTGTAVTGAVDIYSYSGGAITNQGSITQTSGYGYLYGTTFANQGSITANGGSTLYLGYYTGETLSNSGTVTADGAGTNLYVHSIANTGTLTATNGGALRLGGAMTTTGLGTVTIGAGGGHAYLNSGLILDNTGSTLTALGGSTGGAYELYGGTINNGTIDLGGLNFTNYGGTLSGVSYTGDFNLPAGTAVTLTNGSAFTGLNAAIGAGSYLYWEQPGSLVGKTLTMGSGTSSGTVYIYTTGSGLTLGDGTTNGATAVNGNSYFYIDTNDQLTVTPFSGISGTVSISGSGTGSSFTNKGSITNSAGYGGISAANFSNQGSILANGGSQLTLQGGAGQMTTNAAGGTITSDGVNGTTPTSLYIYNLANAGRVTASNGGAILLRGAIPTANLGTVTLGAGGGHIYIDTGLTLDNTGATLNAPTGGMYELHGGTINNGTIGPGALTYAPNANTGTLNSVLINDNLNIPANADVMFSGGTSFSGATAAIGGYGLLYLNQNMTLSGKTITMGSGGLYGQILLGANDTLTIDPTSSISGLLYIDGYYSTNGSTLINQGSITHTAGYGYVEPPTFTNQGKVTVTGGMLALSYYNTVFNNTSTGTVTINGTGASATLGSATTNLGTINVLNGILYPNTYLTNGATGIIKGNGIIYDTLTMSGGHLAVATNPGTLTLQNSAFTVTAPSILDVNLGGTTTDLFLFQNPRSPLGLGAGMLTLNLNLLSAPVPNTTYTFLSIVPGGYLASGYTGYLAGLQSTGDVVTATYLGTPYTFTVDYLTNSIALVSVPEPGTDALLGVGLAALLLRRRRRT